MSSHDILQVKQEPKDIKSSLSSFPSMRCFFESSPALLSSPSSSSSSLSFSSSSLSFSSSCSSSFSSSSSSSSSLSSPSSFSSSSSSLSSLSSSSSLSSPSSSPSSSFSFSSFSSSSSFSLSSSSSFYTYDEGKQVRRLSDLKKEFKKYKYLQGENKIWADKLWEIADHCQNAGNPQDLLAEVIAHALSYEALIFFSDTMEIKGAPSYKWEASTKERRWQDLKNPTQITGAYVSKLLNQIMEQPWFISNYFSQFHLATKKLCDRPDPLLLCLSKRSCLKLPKREQAMNSIEHLFALGECKVLNMKLGIVEYVQPEHFLTVSGERVLCGLIPMFTNEEYKEWNEEEKYKNCKWQLPSLNNWYDATIEVYLLTCWANDYTSALCFLFLLGYSATGSVSRKENYFHQSEKDGGKSAHFNLLSKIMQLGKQSYYKILPADALNPNVRSNHQRHQQNLVGLTRVAMYSEATKSARIDHTIVRKISGKDGIVICSPYSVEGKTYISQAKIHWTMNRPSGQVLTQLLGHQAHSEDNERCVFISWPTTFFNFIKKKNMKMGLDTQEVLKLFPFTKKEILCDKNKNGKSKKEIKKTLFEEWWRGNNEPSSSSSDSSSSSSSDSSSFLINNELYFKNKTRHNNFEFDVIKEITKEMTNPVHEEEKKKKKVENCEQTQEVEKVGFNSYDDDKEKEIDTFSHTRQKRVELEPHPFEAEIVKELSNLKQCSASLFSDIWELDPSPLNTRRRLYLSRFRYDHTFEIPKLSDTEKKKATRAFEESPFSQYGNFLFVEELLLREDLGDMMTNTFLPQNPRFIEFLETPEKLNSFATLILIFAHKWYKSDCPSFVWPQWHQQRLKAFLDTGEFPTRHVLETPREVKSRYKSNHDISPLIDFISKKCRVFTSEAFAGEKSQLLYWNIKYRTEVQRFYQIFGEYIAEEWAQNNQWPPVEENIKWIVNILEGGQKGIMSKNSSWKNIVRLALKKLGFDSPGSKGSKSRQKLFFTRIQIIKDWTRESYKPENKISDAEFVGNRLYKAETTTKQAHRASHIAQIQRMREKIKKQDGQDRQFSVNVLHQQQKQNSVFEVDDDYDMKKNKNENENENEHNNLNLAFNDDDMNDFNFDDLDDWTRTITKKRKTFKTQDKSKKRTQQNSKKQQLVSPSLFNFNKRNSNVRQENNHVLTFDEMTRKKGKKQNIRPFVIKS